MLQRVQVDGIKLTCRVDGPEDSPWLVMSHSLACDHTMWDPQMPALRHYHVVRFDTRGHGASEAPDGEYTIEQLGDDARALLDALGVDRCHFVGLSMGGMIGQQLALSAPTRLLSLTLADTSSRYPASVLPVWNERIALVRAQGMDAVLQPTLERWFTARFREEQPHAVARIAAAIRATPVPGYIGCAHAIPRIDFTSRLESLRCPTLVLVGAEDQGTPLAMAQEIAAAIAGSELHVIDAAAHLSNVEQPERFNALLTAFLKRTDS
jgi:3-oxoadipate enol-lactonase